MAVYIGRLRSNNSVGSSGRRSVRDIRRREHSRLPEPRTIRWHHCAGWGRSRGSCHGRRKLRRKAFVSLHQRLFMRQLDFVRRIVFVVIGNHNVHCVGGDHGREIGALSHGMSSKLVLNVVPINKYRFLRFVSTDWIRWGFLGFGLGLLLLSIKEHNGSYK